MTSPFEVDLRSSWYSSFLSPIVLRSSKEGLPAQQDLVSVSLL